MLLSGSHWLKNRKVLTHRIKQQVQLYLGKEPKDLKLYKKHYHKDIERSWKSSSFSELLNEIAKTQVVFGGDFHPYAQAQRAHLRILRALPAEKRVVIGLECLPYSANKIIKSFLKNELDEASFLKKVQWQKNWGFPWENYKPLFEIAQKKGFEIVGISPKGSSQLNLKKRDLFAADVVSKVVAEDKNTLFYVVIGDLHMAGPHLPSLVKKKYKNKISILSIFFNPEKIYFDLVRKNLETKLEVVKFNNHEFAYIVSPPWVKWQSYLLFLEKHYDSELDPDDDEHELDYTDHIAQLVKLLASDFKLKISADQIAVYSALDRENITHFVNDKTLLKLMNNDMSFYMPKEGFFYLSRTTVNHSATLAGLYFHSRLCGSKKNYWNMPQDFLVLIWQQAMAFFLSKLINPKRKAVSVSALKKQLEVFSPKDRGREALLLAINHKMNELFSIYGDKNDKLDFSPKDDFSFFQAAYFLGEMLGNKVHQLFVAQEIDQKTLMTWLKKNLSSDDFVAFYFKVLKLLDKAESESLNYDRDDNNVVLQQKG